ncbi:hypothetical protein GF373_06840, partial [bacterium]|nr:hypothetical protein [bacterium]
YLDGDHSLSNPKDANEFGFQATVAGDGNATGGNDNPTPIAIGTASKWGESGYDGNYSEDGSYWNFGARVKDDESGYIVEYKVFKEFCLYPLDIALIGFDFGMNDNEPGSTDRKGKWAWWHFDEDTGQRKDSWNDERGWGELELLQTSQLPGVNEWSLY